MESFKGTQGDWYVDNDNAGYDDYHTLCTAISTKGVECFAQVFGGDDEAKANCKLISASKDLLEACQEFVRKCDVGEAKSIKSYNQMTIAINKALGNDSN